MQQRSEEILRLHGVLQRAGIKLSSVASNIMGVSGRAMIDAMVEGSRDPQALAELARGKLRGKIPLLQRALEGRFTSHHALMVSQMLGHIDFLEESIGDLSRELETHLGRFRESLELLKTIPGVQERTAQMIVGEIGIDMERFPTAGQLASWAGICPGNRRTANTRKPEKIRKGGRWLKPALLEATWGAVKENDSYLSAQYHRLVPHMGKKKAAIAVAHSMLIVVYYILKKRSPYHDLGPDFFVCRNQEAIQRRCIRQLKELGFDVSLQPSGKAA